MTVNRPRHPVPQLAVKDFRAMRWPAESMTLTTIAASNTSDVPVTWMGDARCVPIAGVL